MKDSAADLKIGDMAPEFSLTAVGGEFGAGREVSLKDFRGTTVVLYFYPKDDTPGCTVQACGLRDEWSTVRTRAKIFGVSVDSMASHQKFISKYALPFPLLSDPEKKMAVSYGVWVEKSLERSTFVLDGAGRIAAILRKVKPEEHVALLAPALRTSRA